MGGGMGTCKHHITTFRARTQDLLLRHQARIGRCQISMVDRPCRGQMRHLRNNFHRHRPGGDRCRWLFGRRHSMKKNLFQSYNSSNVSEKSRYSESIAGARKEDFNETRSLTPPDRPPREDQDLPEDLNDEIYQRHQK